VKVRRREGTEMKQEHVVARPLSNKMNQSDTCFISTTENTPIPRRNRTVACC